MYLIVSHLSIPQRFFNNIVGNFGSGLDGILGPSVSPSFGVTFGTLPNTVQTPFGGGGGYVDNNPLGLDLGPVSLNPFVGLKLATVNGKKTFVPSLDILVSPNAKGTSAIKNIKNKSPFGNGGYNDEYYYDDSIPISSLPYHHGPSPPPYSGPQVPIYPGPYDQYSPVPQYQAPYVNHPQPYQPNIPVHHVQQGHEVAPIYQVRPPVQHGPPVYQGPQINPTSNVIPSVYPPTGPYLPDYYSQQPQIAQNPYVHDPNSYKKDHKNDVQLHHHVHEHTHLHKGLRNLGIGGSFRDDNFEELNYNPTIEHLGRQFRGSVQTNKKHLPKSEDTFRIPNRQNTFRPNRPQPTRISSSQNRPNQQQANFQSGFKFPHE